MNEEYKTKGWVARDKDLDDYHKGRVHFFKLKPERFDDRMWFLLERKYRIELQGDVFISDKFPYLTWEDDPIEVELTIKKI
jgi:hypothetical protein